MSRSGVVEGWLVERRHVRLQVRAQPVTPWRRIALAAANESRCVVAEGGTDGAALGATSRDAVDELRRDASLSTGASRSPIAAELALALELPGHADAATEAAAQGLTQKRVIGEHRKREAHPDALPPRTVRVPRSGGGSGRPMVIGDSTAWRRPRDVASSCASGSACVTRPSTERRSA